ncbi:MAG: hypothetical protein ACI9MR_003705 [Myxococcota bacterium]|jgi:hypothetical protein
MKFFRPFLGFSLCTSLVLGTLVGCGSEGAGVEDGPDADSSVGDSDGGETGGFTAACLAAVTHTLLSDARPTTFQAVNGATLKLLTGVQRQSVDLFVALHDGSDLDLDQEPVDMGMTFFVDGTLIDVSTGAGWSIKFLFDGQDELLAYHRVDQSPYTEWTCPTSNAPNVEAPNGLCTAALFQFVPHDTDFARKFVADRNADTRAMAAAATAAYLKEGSLAPGEELTLEGTFWSSVFWGKGAAVSVHTDGNDPTIYLMGTNGQTVWILANETNGTWSTQCIEERI